MKISRLVPGSSLLLPLFALLALALAPLPAAAQQEARPAVEREEPNVLFGERAYRR